MVQTVLWCLFFSGNSTSFSSIISVQVQGKMADNSGRNGQHGNSDRPYADTTMGIVIRNSSIANGRIKVVALEKRRGEVRDRMRLPNSIINGIQNNHIQGPPAGSTN
ncbi:hypothetical protein V1264_024002 [Littorina saxatilis]|uniref:Uncharacterized protein n=1 Tax=Littorina saxatilis TaxID=31220 RepID=A0AAN9B8B1_9CAEN